MKIAYYEIDQMNGKELITKTKEFFERVTNEEVDVDIDYDHQTSKGKQSVFIRVTNGGGWLPIVKTMATRDITEALVKRASLLSLLVGSFYTDLKEKISIKLGVDNPHGLFNPKTILFPINPSDASVSFMTSAEYQVEIDMTVDENKSIRENTEYIARREITPAIKNIIANRVIPELETEIKITYNQDKDYLNVLVDGYPKYYRAFEEITGGKYEMSHIASLIRRCVPHYNRIPECDEENFKQKMTRIAGDCVKNGALYYIRIQSDGDTWIANREGRFLSPF